MTTDKTPPVLAEGLYERVITERLARLLAETPDHRRRDLRPAETSRTLGRFLGDYLARALETVPASERPQAQVEIANTLIDTVKRIAPRFYAAGDEVRAELLESVANPPSQRPLLPLSESGLYANANRERQLGLALRAEMASADRVDLICAFLFWEGYRHLRDAITQHLAAGRSLRVMTTTYRGVTQARVLEELESLGATVRVSYNTSATRLHAKAWLFHRESGYSTGFVGSSNLSKTALTAGLEWNVRLSEIENAGTFGELRGTFDALWADAEFEPYEPERFALEVKAERGSQVLSSVFQIRARPHQRAILEKLRAEREAGSHQNLVVAATGTGKTVVAALDYRALCETARESGTSDWARPRLLFVAHRESILKQSRATFCHALSDGSFGERLVDGERPTSWDHVFASVQSLAKVDLDQLAPDHFHTIIVDEFHHAAGNTYRRLLEHFRPTELLGLTATPERPDGISVLGWFSGRIAAELRLQDAIDQGLLVPFQYFAVHDNVDLSHVTWRRGRYVQKELEAVYTGHHARTHLVVEALRRHIAEPMQMRALVFCVGVEHARYVSAALERAGLGVGLVISETTTGLRDDAVRRLRNGELQAIVTVDVFNEGVDIPEVDTVLFLRPTESSIVFLQQLGRGLRRAPGKRCLTVLDMVGRQHDRFRYDVRFRALLGRTGRAALKRQVDQDFPFLPSGCSIELDRVSKELILENLARGIGTDKRSLVRELRELGPVSLRQFLTEAELDLEDLYRGGRTWSDLKRAAGHPVLKAGPRETTLGRGIGRLIHVDDRLRLTQWRRWLAGDAADPTTFNQTTFNQTAIRMLAAVLLGPVDGIHIDRLRRAFDDHPALRTELDEVLSLLEARLPAGTIPLPLSRTVPLVAHAHYRRQEVMAALGDIRNGKLYLPREGVFFHEATRNNLLFVTLQKDEEDFSPSTMYSDYAIDQRRFHWQSQSGTRPDSKKGRRHIQHAELGIRPLLFVRATSNDDRGETQPHVFLGPASLVSWHGERPMNIEWALERPMPPQVLRASAVGRAWQP